LRLKYGLDKEIPSDWKPPKAPKTLEEAKREEELIELAKAGKLVEKKEVEAPPKGPGVRTFNVFVGDEYYQVDVEAVGGAPALSVVPAAASASAAPPVPRAAAPAPPAAEKKQAAPAEVAAGEAAITAPMPGMLIRYEVNVGDRVKAGDIVVLFEAMKMQNNIPSPIDGTVKALLFKPGDPVPKDAVMAIVSP